MDLTERERQMLDGRFGRGVAEAMRIQVAVGDAFGAERMVEITRAHEAFGSSESCAWFLELFSKAGAHARVPITCNPPGELDFLENKGIVFPEEHVALIRRVKEARLNLGIIPTESCTPYLQDNIPHFGETIAFAESSATPYVNGVCGARSNRESTESALAASITGRAPLYGYLLDENRRGDILVNVETTLKDDFDYHLMGYMVGKEAGTRVPVFKGSSPMHPSPEQLTALSAQLATGGAVGMFHIVGFTPEAPNLETAFGGEHPKGEITITDDDLEKARKAMSFEGEKIDFLMFGCPHYSIHQVREVARLLEGRKIHNEVEFWVMTSFSTRELARRLGYLEIINKAGGDLMSGACPDGSYFRPRYKGKIGITDSPKAWYYPQRSEIRFVLRRRSDCIEAAVKGGCS